MNSIISVQNQVPWFIVDIFCIY